MIPVKHLTSMIAQLPDPTAYAERYGEGMSLCMGSLEETQEIAAYAGADICRATVHRVCFRVELHASDVGEGRYEWALAI